MIKSGFSYLKLTAVLAVLAMALVPPMRTSAARTQPSPAATSDANLANEERVIAKFCDDLVAYDKQVAELDKRERLAGTDLDALQRRSDELKGRLSGVQSAIGEIIRKLKTANEWDDLDARLAAKITYTDVRRSFLQQSSFKQLLEDSASGLTSRRNEIGLPLDSLRKRLTSRDGTGVDLQIVRAGYTAPARPLYLEKLQCALGKVRLKVVVKNGGLPADDVWRNVWINCNVGQACCPFTN